MNIIHISLFDPHPYVEIPILLPVDDDDDDDNDNIPHVGSTS
jgi:hypothetical protein